MTAPLVCARDVAKRFGAVSALEGIHLEVEAGSTLALVGPNGAGKSTLLRLLAGLARPSHGEVRVAGAPAHRKEARARVGLVAHASHLYGALTARENLLFAARLHGVADGTRRADALLSEFGLEAAAARVTAGFSRGMAQRLAIARALLHDPELLLLDEPFTGVDRRGAERLRERIRSLAAAHRTLVLVTHDVARAASLADRALLLVGGRVVHEATGPALSAQGLEAAWDAAEARTA